MPTRCEHLGQVTDVAPRTPQGCEECNDHATRHPIIRSFERGEDWGWCYVDELVLQPAPRAGAQP